MSWLPFWRHRPASVPPKPAAAGTSLDMAPPSPAVPGRPAPSAIESRALDALHGVNDPELGINIVDLGLVYEVEANGGRLRVRLAMTTPSCPLGEHLTGEAERALRRALPEVGRIEVDLVRDPPWSPERMTEAARRQLGWG
jgi:metal-sulfur cluster biosynthetic enzyme